MKNLLLVLATMASLSSNAQSQTYFKQDKLLHMAAGSAIGSVSTIILTKYTKNPDKAMLIGIGVAGVFAFGKEAYDMGVKGNTNWTESAADIIATVIGGAIGSGLIRVTVDITNEANQSKGLKL